MRLRFDDWTFDSGTRELVRRAIADTGASDVKQTGMVIGSVMKSGAAVDGATVSRLVREELGA